MPRLAALGVVLLLGLAACVPRITGPLDGGGIARLAPDSVITADGYRLPLRSWLPSSDAASAPALASTTSPALAAVDPVDPVAVVVAVHGFNDYSNAFRGLADPFNAAGIALYAYDQRGFGATVDAGLWAGTAALTADLRGVLMALRTRHPGVPVYVLGESMVRQWASRSTTIGHRPCPLASRPRPRVMRPKETRSRYQIAMKCPRNPAAMDQLPPKSSAQR